MGEDMYFKVPLVHANRKCEARAGDGQGGAMRSLISGKYVYVPVDDCEHKYDNDYFDPKIVRTLEQILRDNVRDPALKKYQESLTGVNRRISDLIDIGKHHKVFEEHRYPTELKAIMLAVEEADSEVASFGDPLTAKDLLTAITKFHEETDIRWAERILNKIDSEQKLANKLSGLAQKDSVDDLHIDRSGETNTYILEYEQSNYKVVEATSIQDLLELPCISNLHELASRKESPERWYLYSFVRIILELDADLGVADIKEWFSQYPWYKEDTTDYQVRYEKKQRMEDDDPPLPVGCNNDNRKFERICIGREHCDYSIYQSLNFKPEVYDRLGE
jgi:hypothetical protein